MAAAAGFFGGHVFDPSRELGAAYDAAMQRLVFDPLGMSATTADFDRALAGNHAAGHGQDVDGHVRVASQGLNLAAISTRPSGNHWSNVRDMLRYVRMELDGGLRPDGGRYIRQDVLLARREPQVTEGLNEYYGMGLKIDQQWGVPVIHHGGSAAGYRSDMIWLPDDGVGAVLLINSDTGSLLRAMFRRRLLEVLFDGQRIAAEDLKSNAQHIRAATAEQREQLTVPADPDAVAQLARRYRSGELGVLEVRKDDGATWFDLGGWSSEMATRQDQDVGMTFVTVSPGEDGFEFIVADQDGRRRLTVRDAQHEYVFTEER
jgi:CubicO group peptidase (beta-lactamase class C family)